MQYGHFDDPRREYVITRPDTPLPWINYLGGEDFFGIVSNTAGGYSFFRDPRLRRLTRYRYQSAPADVGSRFLYLRDEDGSAWSPTWQPMRTDLDDYTCRHGMGYTIISSRRCGISSEVTYLVPPGENLELWRVAITNERDVGAHVTLFGAVEFALWDAWDDATNFQRNLNTGEVQIGDGIVYHLTEYRERRNHLAYFACTAPTAGYDSRREAFLGPYRGWEDPAAVAAGACTGSVAHGWAPIGAHQVDLDLAPGETRVVPFLLGYHENPKDAKFDPPGSQRAAVGAVEAVVDRYRDDEAFTAARAAIETTWDGLLDRFVAATPDLHTDRMVNIWNAYQCMVTFHMSRNASGFESGVGRGMGFRDSNQDLLGLFHMIPSQARERILDLAATQLRSGGAYHQYQPLTKRGNDGVGSGFNDDPLWLVLSVAGYLKETGDWSILDEPVVYENRPGTETPLAEHLERAISYTTDRLGPHRLPLMGRADWNDCLNLNTFSSEPGESFQTAASGEGGVAESVFIAGQFVLAAGEMADIAARRGDEQGAARYREAADRVTAAVDAHGWDGDWFLRAYDHYGGKIGSQTCDEGQIYVEPQGMCVMAGIGIDDGRAARAVASVGERLATPHGIVLHAPAYTCYRIELGEITSYPPGYKENGGIFCHTNPWIMIAAAKLGDGDLAHDYYLRINPSAREHLSDLHRCEPYVYAQMIAGREAPTHGEAKNSWLTGTASWNYVAVTRWILGVRPEHDGLRIDPRIPSGWEGFRVTRWFRGAEYRITARRRGPGNDVALSVDGEPVAGRVIGPAPAGSVVAVEAMLGT
jgi:cellobiose phosphorylase